ncbi:MAG: NAD/NADP octopine/nopaline dehydrogenase family protein [Clostridia bacterium]
MKTERILIIGAGHGGYTAAADLLLAGFQVSMYELPEYQRNLFPMIESGRIKLTGEKQGFVTIPRIEAQLDQAMRQAELILIMTHAQAHARIAELMAPHVRQEQAIVLVPGYTGGALCFEQIFNRLGVKKGYLLAETNTLPYASRKITDESAVHMKLYLKKVLLSVFPAKFNTAFLPVFRRLYPNAQLVENVLETGFNNGNPVLNVAPVVLNAGRIEYAKGEYYHFQEGVSPAVARVLEQVDEERVLLGRELGIKTIPYLERVIETGYVLTNENWYEMISTSPHLSAKGPDSLAHRYLTEDVPFGLVPWYDFAQERNVRLPLMASLIQLASALTGVDYFQEGRKVADMGLVGMDSVSIRDYLYSGER